MISENGAPYYDLIIRRKNTMDKYSIKSAYKRFKKENNGSKEQAIAKARIEIDEYISSSVVDSEFYKKYYDIKRLVQVHNTISPSLLMGLYTGMIVTVSFRFLDSRDIVGYLIFLFVSVIVSYAVSIWCLASVPNCILYPHMLKRMEEKLEKEKVGLPQISKTEIK